MKSDDDERWWQMMEVDISEWWWMMKMNNGDKWWWWMIAVNDGEWLCLMMVKLRWQQWERMVEIHEDDSDDDGMTTNIT